MEVDLVIAGSGFEAIALGRATRMAIDGVEVPVAHATDLVVMKALAGRGKDLDDLRSLLAGGEGPDRGARPPLPTGGSVWTIGLVPRLDAAIADVTPGAV